MPDATPAAPGVAAVGNGAATQTLDRLGAYLPKQPVPLNHENVASFRAVSSTKSLTDNLGPLGELPGRWAGNGFNIIARPDFQGGNDIFLELNLTRENLDFSTIGSAIPNRGHVQDDINLFGVHYLQQISDAVTGGALHIEPGIWLNIPVTSAPSEPATVARLATIPHGDALNAQGSAIVVPNANDPSGGPLIKPANTIPFPIGGSPPAVNGFPEYDLSKPNAFRTNPVPPGVTQEMINNPNVLLTNDIISQEFVTTTVLIISTTPSGGVENIPFVVTNANAASLDAIFWIETVKDPNGGTFMQLQYTQTVILDFGGLSWPHVSVATLFKVF